MKYDAGNREKCSNERGRERERNSTSSACDCPHSLNLFGVPRAHPLIAALCLYLSAPHGTCPECLVLCRTTTALLPYCLCLCATGTHPTSQFRNAAVIVIIIFHRANTKLMPITSQPPSKQYDSQEEIRGRLFPLLLLVLLVHFTERVR